MELMDTLIEIEEQFWKEGAAVLSYRAAASRDSGDTRYEALVSSVYVEHADGWKLAFHQQTPGG